MIGHFGSNIKIVTPASASFIPTAWVEIGSQEHKLNLLEIHSVEPLLTTILMSTGLNMGRYIKEVGMISCLTFIHVFGRTDNVQPLNEDCTQHHQHTTQNADSNLRPCKAFQYHTS